EPQKAGADADCDRPCEAWCTASRGGPAISREGRRLDTKSWRERLSAARSRGHFTQEDCALASDWDRCAVGEQRAMLPTVVVCTTRLIGREDETLNELGRRFYAAIKAGDIAEAERLLDKIEDRILEMKRRAAHHADAEVPEQAMAG